MSGGDRRKKSRTPVLSGDCNHIKLQFFKIFHLYPAWHAVAKIEFFRKRKRWKEEGKCLRRTRDFSEEKSHES